MNSNKWKHMIMLICISILIIFCITLLIRKLTVSYLVNKWKLDNCVTQAILFDDPNLRRFSEENKHKNIKIDWEKLYPFYEDNPVIPTHTNIIIPKRHKDRALWVNTMVINYMSWISAANTYNKIIGWDITPLYTYNSPVRLSDGQWAEYQKKVDVSDKVEALVQFNKILKEKGIKFLVLMAPSKIDRTDKSQSGIFDFSNQNGDEFISTLEAENIRCIDIRKYMEKEGKTANQLFYKTDHHWTAAAGMWAAHIVGDTLNESYGYHIETDKLSQDNYREKKYEKIFLGSRGRKVTLAKAAPEDFSLYYPKFITSYHYEIPSKGIDVTGDFSVMYDMSNVNSIDYYNINTYSAYGYADVPLIRIKNKNIHDGHRLLILKNSYGNVVVPFLSTTVNEIHVLDLRHFTGSLQTYIKEYGPDTVLFIMSMEGLSNENIEYTREHKNLWDFR